MTAYPYAVMAQEPFALNKEPENNNIIISTRFMEVMQPVRAIAPGTDFTPFLNMEGNLDLYTVGTGNQVYRLKSTEGNDASYQMQDLAITARALSVFEWNNSLDFPDIMGIGDDGKLTRSQYDNESKTYKQKVDQPVDATEKLQQFKATKLNETIYVNVVFEDGTVGNSFIKQDGTWASSTWALLKDPDGVGDAKALKIAMCNNNPVQNALYAISEDKTVWFADSKTRFTKFQNLGFLTVRDIYIVEDSENLLNIFAIGHITTKPDDDNNVWVKRQKKHPSKANTIEWDDWSLVSDTVVGKAVRVALDASNALKVFVMQDDDLSSLFVIREQQDRRGRRDGWTVAFPLGRPTPDAIFSVAQDPTGLAQAFTVGLNHGSSDIVACRFWQDPTTTNWVSAAIHIGEPDTAISLPAHSVDILLQDGVGAALPMIKFTVSSSSPATLTLQGRSYTVGPLNAPIELQADAAGAATMTIVTNSLSAPELIFTLDGMKEGEALTIAPNAELQSRLHVMTSDDILVATRKDGKPLLPGTEAERKQNAVSIAEIGQRAMSLGMKGDKNLAPKVPYLWKNQSSVGLGYHSNSNKRNPSLLVASNLEEQHWRVRFDDNLVHCEDIDRSEAEGYLAKAHALKTSASPSTLPGFLDIDWGDIWESVKNGVDVIVDGLKEFVVTTSINPITGIVDALRVVFKLVIVGVEYIIDKTVELLQQAFDIIEGVWNKIKVFFEDLYQWLAFLFNLPDFVRSQKAIEHSMNESIDFAKIAITNIRGTVAAGLDSISNSVENAMDTFAKELAGESLNQYSKEHENDEGRAATLESGSHNVVGNAFSQNYERASGNDGVRLQSVVDESALNTLLKTLFALSENFQFGEGKEAFEAGLEYFKDIASSPDKMLDLAMAGLVKVMEGIALTCIAIAKGVVLSVFDLLLSLFDLVKTMANYRLKIPILSPIYKYFTGKTLDFSILGVTALIVALPTTIGYKVATGSAPFPDDASLEAFKKEVTAENMAKAAGFTVKGAGMVRTSQVARFKASESLQKAMAWCLFGTFIVRAFVEPIQNGIVAAGQLEQKAEQEVEQKIVQKLEWFGGLKKFAKSAVGLCTWVLRMLTSIFSAPWLTQDDPGKPGCESGKAFGQIVWIMQLVLGPVLGGIIWFYAIFGAPPKDPKVIGTVNITRLIIWGAIHLGMVIGQAIAGGFSSGLLTARSVVGCLAPQVFWFALLKDVSTKTEGISVIALMAFSAVSMASNAVLTAVVATTIGRSTESGQQYGALPVYNI